MRRLHILFAAAVLSLSLLFVNENIYAAAWERNEEGIYVNSSEERIERAALRGIDVSYAQGIIDWEQVKNDDVSFVIIRCGSGANLTENDDSKWAYNVSECERLGIPYGVYHYSRATTEVEAIDEAQHVLRLLEGHTLSYPVYYDLEGTETSAMWSVSNEQHLKNAQAFCSTIEAAGYQTGIYSNMNWFKNKLTDPWYKTKNLWIARYISDYTYNWEEMIGFSGMWQCSQTGSVDGISGDVDINFYIEAFPEQVAFSNVKSAGYNQHTLTWEPVSRAQGYEVWCMAPGKTEFSLIKKVLGDTTTVAIGKRTTGKNYSYQVRAFKTINGAVEYGEFSSVRKVKAVPDKAVLKQVKRLNNKKVKLKWNKVSGANGYKIYYSTKKGSGYKLLTTVKKGSKVSVNVTVKKGKRYYYKVRAYRTVSKKAVYGAYSNMKSCK